MPASTSSTVGAAGNILLVQEYRALAVAISSALKKFAPAHRTHVAASLSIAEALALAHEPELLVIDFDPPQRDAAVFFNRLKFALPDARVLLLAAALPRDVLAARKQRSAFRFIEKPFDLAGFGAAVEEAIGTQPSGEHGTLADLNLTDVLLLHCGAKSTLVINVDAAAGRSGEIHLAHGQIVHALASGRIGTAALEEMLRWEMPRLSETERAAPAARTIDQAWPALLADVFAQARPAPLPEIRRKRPKKSNEPTRKLVVIDDTELLLIFVEEILETADGTIEIVTAQSGVAGVEQVRSAKPDAVLLDFSLPDITGDEVCRQLLEDPGTAAIPIIMMSGHVPEMKATAERYGNVAATIAKPFLSHALVDLVRKTLAAPRVPAPPLSSNPPSDAPAKIEAPEIVSPAPAVEQLVAAESSTNGDGEHLYAPSPPPDDAKPQSAMHAPEVVPMVPTVADLPASEPVESSAVRVVSIPRKENIGLRARLATTAARLRVLPREPVRSATHLITPPGPCAPASQERAPAVGVSSPKPLPRVRIAAATQNAVVLGLSLEVLAMRFSSALRMAAIRARPWSWTVSLHVHPNALPGVRLPEAGFDLGRVELNARGHIDAVRLVPSAGTLTRPPAKGLFPVGDVTLLPGNGDRAMELLPTAAAPMTMQLFASFELVDVELSPTFGIGALVLKSRGGDIRVTLQPATATTGATFKTAQVLLDRSARIAEILLDAVA